MYLFILSVFFSIIGIAGVGASVLSSNIFAG